MTTANLESSCHTDQQQQQQQQQQLQQQVALADRTTELKATCRLDSTIDLVESEDPRLQERPKPKQQNHLIACDIEPIGGQQQQQQQQQRRKRRAELTGDQLVDSRSILNNKEKLKRFWERRMELEFESQRQQVAESASGKKIVDFDDNNNNNNNNNDHDEEIQSNGIEWQSLSPNVGQLSRDQQAGQQQQPNGKNVPTNESNSKGNQNQLMSLDPTLCHDQPHKSHNPKAEQLNSIENEDCEEQYANEEFSSSNSSFGPMSISQHQRQDLDTRETAKANAAAAGNVSQSDEELNSTLSGSVLTVITNSNRDEEAKVEPNSIELEVSEENDGDDEGDDESGSNIGVAFESLQFDTEIKSSKHERVEDNLLMVSSPVQAAHCQTPQQSPSSLMRQQQQQAATLMPKFNASQVKSVCSFISAAISDATKQVERITNPQNRATLVNTEAPPQAADCCLVVDSAAVAASSSPSPPMSRHRATFVREDEGEVDSNGETPKTTTTTTTTTIVNASPAGRGVYAAAPEPPIDEDHQSEEEEEAGEQAEVQKADLSSIFEANVRREIERFESNSMVRRLPFGSRNGGNNFNDLMAGAAATTTEWKIAEEIRLFNERELELKRRLNKPSSSNRSASKSASRHTSDSQHEAIVRNGKTFQIPKAKGLNMLLSPQPLGSPSSQSANRPTSAATENSNHLTKCIKLTTSVSGGSPVNTQSNQQQQQAATMISMHKFISSGGKRYVYTSSSGGSQHNSSSTASSTLSLHSGQQFTKSMSNLSTIGKSCNSSSINNSNADSATMRRDADYKAIDSLKCKETPNVEPGTTKKVIETFSRNFQQQHVDYSTQNTNSAAAAANAQQNSRNKFKHCNGAKRQVVAPIVNSGNANGGAVLSAEMKIQEELRDMRAREAELRDQQRRRYSESSPEARSATLSKNHSKSPLTPSKNPLGGGQEAESSNIDTDDYEADIERICALDKQQINAGNHNNDHDHPQTGDNKLSYSSDSLYPIKQAIDTFRRLNTASSQQQDFKPKRSTANGIGGSSSISKIQQKFLG